VRDAERLLRFIIGVLLALVMRKLLVPDLSIEFSAGGLVEK
jgi:hypothetical protein